MAATADFFAEEADLYDNCSKAAAAAFKFFDMIRVEMPDDKAPPSAPATVRFGKTHEDDQVPREIAKQIRSYVKEQKRQIRSNPYGIENETLKQKIFWILSMFVEHGVFSASQQQKIQIYTQYAWVFMPGDE